jgi:hypothetical protein
MCNAERQALKNYLPFVQFSFLKLP